MDPSAFSDPSGLGGYSAYTGSALGPAPSPYGASLQTNMTGMPAGMGAGVGVGAVPPMLREEMVQSASRFLQHPDVVRTSPQKRIQFLEKKVRPPVVRSTG